MLTAAIDIGGTKTMVAAAVLREGAQKRLLGRYDIIGSETFETAPRTQSLGELLFKCTGILANMIRGKGYDAGELAGVGISAPGMVDAATQRLIFAPGTGWRNADICAEIRKNFAALGADKNLFVRMDNDVNVCARAEAMEGGLDNLFWMTVSTGIGGAFVVNGEVWGGAHSVAGEIGHLKVEYTKPRLCACGQLGCAEAHCSGTAVGTMAKERAAVSPLLLARFREIGGEVDAKSCAELAGRGEPEALEIFGEAGMYLGRAVAAAVNLFDPAAVYIGGGMSRSLDLLLPHIKEQLALCTVSTSAQTPVLPTALGYTAALHGAFSLML